MHAFRESVRAALRQREEARVSVLYAIWGWDDQADEPVAGGEFFASGVTMGDALRHCARAVAEAKERGLEGCPVIVDRAGRRIKPGLS